MAVHQNIFKSMKDIRFEDTISHQCGITMNDSVEARAIAEVMEKKPHVMVTYQPALIRIDGDPKLEFKMDEISEALGRPMTPHLFEISNKCGVMGRPSASLISSILNSSFGLPSIRINAG